MSRQLIPLPEVPRYAGLTVTHFDDLPDATPRQYLIPDWIAQRYRRRLRAYNLRVHGHPDPRD